VVTAVPLVAEETGEFGNGIQIEVHQLHINSDLRYVNRPMR
jgi:hypothetical protein